MVTSAHRVGLVVRESTGAGSVGRQYSVPAPTWPSPWDQALFDLTLTRQSAACPPHLFPLLSETETWDSVSRIDSGSSASGDGHVPWSELVGITNKLKPGKLSCY